MYISVRMSLRTGARLCCVKCEIKDYRALSFCDKTKFGDIVTTCLASWRTAVADKLINNIVARQEHASSSSPSWS